MRNLLLSFLLIFSFSCAHKASDNTKEFSKNLNESIFEIIVPFSLESKKVKFDKKIDYSKLPAQIKKMKYSSIGSAFAISDRYLASAAHVFNAHKESQLMNRIAIRDQRGKVYKIDKVIKYSQADDLIVFSLKKYPRRMKPLNLNPKSNPGDIIYTVGNALGQGIVVRKGTITSFTAEEMRGEWKFIRFTAAASPGNSGGALINNQKEVVGIVVRRSENENLNYAVPVKVLNDLTKKHAIFYDRSYKEIEDTKSLHTVWKDNSIKLPMKLRKFQKTAWKKFIVSFRKRRKAFEKKYKKELFPYNKEIYKTIPNYASAMQSFRFVQKRDQKDWDLYSAKNKSIKIDDYKVNIGVRSGRGTSARGEVHIVNPDNKDLKSFVLNSKLQSEILLKAIGLNLKLGGTESKIISAGKAFKLKKWRDKHGRTWTSGHWAIPLIFDIVISTHCLPMPYGVSCMFSSGPTWDYPNDLYYFKKGAEKEIISYYGTAKQWSNFKKLPKVMRPTFLNDFNLSYQKNKLVLDYNNQKKYFPTHKLSQGDDVLEVAFALSAQNLKLQDALFYYRPSLDYSTNFVIGNIIAPHPDAEKESVRNWKQVIGKRGKYSGKLSEKGNNYQAIYTKKINSRIVANESWSSKEALFGVCKVDLGHSKKVANKLCKRFKNWNNIK